MSYQAFVARKLTRSVPTGFAPPKSLGFDLFPFQVDLVRWALRRGRSAIFAGTGLGKTRMQIAWAKAVQVHTKRPVLILAPLAVSTQTAAEAEALGYSIAVARTRAGQGPCVTVTNYERLHHFDPAAFSGVVLDESSCIKHHDTKTLATLLEAFSATPFKLCATATPAPNDWTELGTHAEFLGVCSRAEMLSEFFCHDGGDTSTWRLKGHARAAFWRFVASWGALVSHPRDLGYDQDGYDLPPLRLHEHVTAAEVPTGFLFAPEAGTLTERRRARKDSLGARVQACAETIKAEWAKLADRGPNALEAGIRKESQAPERRGSESRGAEAPSAARREQDTRAEGLHARLPGEAPGEMGPQPGVSGPSERRSTRALRERSRRPSETKGPRAGVGVQEPGQTKGTAPQSSRTLPSGFQEDAQSAARSLRHLRLDGPNRSELLPGGRPLPQDEDGPRAAMHAVQHGPREVQGQPTSTTCCDPLPETWIVWCDLNAEQDALEALFGVSAFSVRGADSPEIKEDRVKRWLAGERPVLISKPSIMGWGLNFQHCARMAFVGVTDSFESYYQAVRRCWRFGQARPVDVHVFASPTEWAVVQNLQRKERDAEVLAASLAQETAETVRTEVRGQTRQTNAYNPNAKMEIPTWLATDA